MEKERVEKINQMAADMRRLIIEMTYEAKADGSHIGGGLSSVEILACLYGGVFRIAPAMTQSMERDFFILSKAHCVVSFYAALYLSGFMKKEELQAFEKNDSDLPGHPVMNGRYGIEFSGGSLGMGLAQGVGMAMALRKQERDNYVVVLMGDGECNEGSVWESAMAASHFSLDQLIGIVDYNKVQADGLNQDVMALGRLSDKFSGFGFEVIEVDGHCVEQLMEAFEKAKANKNGKPKMILAHTVKGKGISFMENKAEWHHARLNDEQYQAAIAELEVGGQDDH